LWDSALAVGDCAAGLVNEKGIAKCAIGFGKTLTDTLKETQEFLRLAGTESLTLRTYRATALGIGLAANAVKTIGTCAQAVLGTVRPDRKVLGVYDCLTGGLNLVNHACNTLPP